MGIKLEQYIFDAFLYAPSTALFEVTYIPSSYFTPDVFFHMLLCS